MNKYFLLKTPFRFCLWDYFVINYTNSQITPIGARSGSYVFKYYILYFIPVKIDERNIIKLYIFERPFQIPLLKHFTPTR